VDLRHQLGLVRKWVPILAAGAVLGTATAFAVSSVQQPVFEARATLMVGQALQALNPDVNQLIVSQRLSSTYAAVATKRPALEHVIQQLGLDQTPDQLARRVWAEAPIESTLLVLNAQDTDPARAAAIANALAERVIASSPGIQGLQSELQKSIEAELRATQEQIRATQARVDALAALESPTAAELATLESLQGRLVTLRSTYASLLASSAQSAANLLTVIEPAVAPAEPVLPRVLLNTLLGALVGLLLAAAVAAAIEYLDDRVKDSDAVQELVGLSTLGTVSRMDVGRGRPEFYRLATLLYPRSALAEAYRTLRTNVEFASVDVPITTLLVTSAGPHEGKTVSAANLAVAFAQAGRLTILVDADLRKPGIDQIFRLSNEQGLTTMLRSDEASVHAVAHATEQANLRIVTTGPLPPNPAELLGSQRMRRTVDKIKEAADIVVFDTPPVQVVADAAVLSSYLDATVLVIDAGRSHRRALRDTRETLDRAGAKLLGVILNRVPKGSPSSASGYYYQDTSGAPAGNRPSATEGTPT
jgi:polysaccharide biosynthesis transport protein